MSSQGGGSATTIRPAHPDDSPVLRAIERAAGERYRTVGLDAVADDEPTSVGALDVYAAAGHSWVAVDQADHPVAYVLVDVVDGLAHLDQLSVRPDQQGRGLARALVARVGEWASESGRPGVTLTTFAEVPWNRPLYQHLGFRVLADEEIGPELDVVRTAETERGLDPTTRVCMRLDIDVRAKDAG
jgi:GNAT superfamily N-acetyltransferase